MTTEVVRKDQNIKHTFQKYFSYFFLPSLPFSVMEIQDFPWPYKMSLTDTEVAQVPFPVPRTCRTSSVLMVRWLDQEQAGHALLPVLKFGQ